MGDSSERGQMRNLLFALSFVVVGCGGAPVDPAESPVRTEPQAATPPPEPTVTAAPAASAAAKPPAHWAYSGDEGPAKWGSLSPDYAKCASGGEQTPIDLAKATSRNAALAPLALQIKPFPAVFTHNGHTVQALAKGSGSTFTAGGKTYELVQLHLHEPAEHTVDKKAFDGELHLVHSDAQGALAVVGVFLKKGKENKALAPYFDHLPSAPNQEPVKAEGVMIDVASIFPQKAPYFTYSGSLTTPPCSEGVSWFVLTTPIEVSEAQLAKFRAAVPGDSNRPVLPIGARKVEQYRP
jgi:carbonic anhydrase